MRLRLFCVTTSTDTAGAARFRPRDLRPGGFAFVMATGIVSTSIMNSGASAIATAMFVVAACCRAACDSRRPDYIPKYFFRPLFVAFR